MSYRALDITKPPALYLHNSVIINEYESSLHQLRLRRNKILALTPFLYPILQNFLEADSVRLHMILL